MTPPRAFPLSGICDRCLRNRDDLFQHPEGQRYCANVFACEWRYYAQGERPGKYQLHGPRVVAATHATTQQGKG